MKTEHIVLVGLIVLIVVFVINKGKKESFLERCGNKFKDQNYYFNERSFVNRCYNNCQCDGLRLCSKWRLCTGRAR